MELLNEYKGKAGVKSKEKEMKKGKDKKKKNRKDKYTENREMGTKNKTKRIRNSKG